MGHLVASLRYARRAVGIEGEMRVLEERAHRSRPVRNKRLEDWNIVTTLRYPRADSA
jgi:hypothetical protein